LLGSALLEFSLASYVTYCNPLKSSLYRQPGADQSWQIVAIVYAVPLPKRPMYQGMIGSVFALSSIVGPIIGGAFTSNAKVTWRWCFYIVMACLIITGAGAMEWRSVKGGEAKRD
jgi:MFS family permease